MVQNCFKTIALERVGEQKQYWGECIHKQQGGSDELISKVNNSKIFLIVQDNWLEL